MADVQDAEMNGSSQDVPENGQNQMDSEDNMGGGGNGGGGGNNGGGAGGGGGGGGGGDNQNARDDERKLFVGGLSWETTEKDLREHFGQYGEIESINVKTDPTTGRSRGFAFIVYKASDSIDKVVAAGEHVLNNKKVDPKRAKARPGKIFVGGLTSDISDDEIKTFFGQFGTIVEVELPFDKQKNQRKGFCFITYESVQVVNELLKTPKQTIAGKEVDVKKATPKPDGQMGGMGGGMGGMGGGRGGNMRGGMPGRGGMRGRGGPKGGFGGGWGGPGGYGYDSYSGGYGGQGYGGGGFDGGFGYGGGGFGGGGGGGGGYMNGGRQGGQRGGGKGGSGGFKQRGAGGGGGDRPPRHAPY